MSKTFFVSIIIIGSLIIIGILTYGNLSGIPKMPAVENQTNNNSATSTPETDINTNTNVSTTTSTTTPETIDTTASTTPNNNPAGDIVSLKEVKYTNAGFSPSTLTINKGESVIFTNDSSGSMWIASDPHPSHTAYPEFDQLESVAQGGSYTFVFQKTGTWGYHNHVNSGRTGTIIVK